MFHAPLPVDPDTQDNAPPDEVVESITLDLGNDRLRDAHLHNGQVEGAGACSLRSSRSPRSPPP